MRLKVKLWDKIWIQKRLVLKLIMSKIFDWAKRNWLTLVLLLVILYLFGRNTGIPLTGVYNTAVDSGFGGVVGSPMMTKSFGAPSLNIYQPSVAPVASERRMVVQDTSLSMQVNDVSVALTGIEKLATDMGGYMVDRSMNKPEGAATGNITVRVPTEKREDTLKAIKALGIKTVSEDVSGYDVTDQYVDLQGRIDGLTKTKSKMQALMDQATKVEDLMNIQLQLNNIQEQIDSYVGRQKYLEQTAKLTRISVNLSTDELALPYAPDTAFRPGVIFKTAVRSMIGTLRSVASAVIWLVVYIPVIVLIVVIVWIVKVVLKRMQMRKQ